MGAGAARYEIREVTPWSGGGWQNYIDYGGIGIGSNDGNQRQMIMFTDGAGSNNIFTAATSENGGSTWEADFVIQQDGNVGIGTESPAAKLDVSGDVNINSVYKIGTETVLSARGTDNIFVGAGAGENNAGDNGTFVGFAAGASNEGNDNTFVGREVGKNHTTGSINTYIGTIAGYFDTEGQNNTFIGGGAGFLNTTGSENTYVGTFAGNSNQVGVGNVFIGYQAGYNETDSSKLYIANGPDTSDVLIYGDFSTGNVGLGTLDPAEKLDINGTTQMTGFKMPTGASDGYVLTSDGSGVGSWQTPSATDNDWVRSTPDSVLFTAHLLGIARGGAGNRLYGDEVHTHINFGITCTTGTSGENDSYCTIGGGICNSAGAGATVAGGYHNAARDYWATVGGGVDNTASGGVATVGGGNSNTASGDYAIVSGGYNNTAGGADATVGGGYFNAANGDWSTVGGGAQNTASGADATVGGGESNTASDQYATVGGGASNTASYLAATVGGGEFNLASGYAATVGGGYRDTSAAGYSFTVGSYSMVAADYSNSVAFNGQTATASGQTRVGTISKASGTFTIDHPLDPTDKILNHYFVESPEMVLIYRGAATIGADSRAEVHLPDYFDALNQNPMVQLTGVGTAEVVYVAEKVKGNRFVIGGKPGTEVYWTVTAERKDQSAEITKILMPVEQPKDGSLAGRSLDDDFLATTMMQLERMGQADMFDFRTQRGRARYEDSRRAIENR
ncbi:MAG: hypothetical protein AMJ92_08075 [candidate division Zixibacteria bacterium SM23_81]|nr:MAG: hypothetical protein AMJ92_08075 [candidate division Zixibacteria bacterium SM23_81]